MESTAVYSNAVLPIDFSEEGNVMFFNAVQPANVPSGMLDKPSGSLTDSSDVHDVNAYDPNVAFGRDSIDGSEMDFRDLHELKVDIPM